jgi:branched-chain amino acid transport system permease protein
MRRRDVLSAAGFACALAVPLTGVYPVFMMKLLCLAMFACSFNLLLGFGGMLSFGHAAFFGAAAYACGWFVTERHAGPALAVCGGVLVAAALGVVIGVLAIRRRGIYLAMVTLALAQLIYFLCLEAPFTGGENGLQGVGRGVLFGLLPLKSDVVLYYVVLAAFIAVYVLIRRVVHSPFGQVLKGIRENEQRAISLGYSINRYRLLAFVLSASLAGVAGAIKTIVLGFATLADVSQSASGEVVLMTLLGGIGTFFGPVLGAGIVVTLQEYLSDLVGGWVTVIIGAIFVAGVVAFRRGIVGEFARWSREP